MQQLGAASGKKEQFRFTSHGFSRFGVQKELSNGRSNLGKTRFVDGQNGPPSYFESAHQAPDLGRFPTRFASFKGDKQTGHSTADKPAVHETQPRKSVSASVKVATRVAKEGHRTKHSSIASLPLTLTLGLPQCFPLFNFHSTCYRSVMSQYWMVKQEPTAYSWDQFAADGKTDWTGVRNFQARNNLRSMKLGDSVFYYHSVNGKAVVGIAKVTKEAFRDPTAAEGDWSAVELTAVKPIDPPVKVEQIKKEPKLSDMPLLRNSRLSVMPLTKVHFETILELAKAAQSG
jgi:predicted RNA-binding protein with PUA-like domain